MGYEIKYSFYPRKEEGIGYDVNNPQNFTKQLGKLEEIPVEKLANVIMMQLARRDIMVFDVEIHEFIKRKVSFKETKGGVLIKNKKFLLDGTIEVVEEEPQPIPEPIKPTVINYSPPKDAQQILRFEIYDPDPGMVGMFKLTPKKKYPIFEERVKPQKVNLPGVGITEMAGYEYLTIDDIGAKIYVPERNFIPEPKPLVGMENVRVQENHAKLSYMGNVDLSMPVLR